jgi:hypothetical protein
VEILADDHPLSIPQRDDWVKSSSMEIFGCLLVPLKEFFYVFNSLLKKMISIPFFQNEKGLPSLDWSV